MKARAKPYAGLLTPVLLPKSSLPAAPPKQLTCWPFFGEEFMKEGDEVIISTMEHHSNIVPWQLLAARKGISIKVIPMNDQGELLLDEYEKLFQIAPV